MNNLKPVIFIVPVAALILVSILYLLLLKRTSDKSIFKRFVLNTIFLAFIFNLSWELIQMPLYNKATYDIKHIAFCGLASVADAIMVLLLYFGFGLTYNNPLWARHLSWQRICLLILVGGIGAILAEMRHLSAGNWSYGQSMPIIPIVNVGLSPVLQFIILPLVIYYMGFKFIRNRKMKAV